MPYLDLLVEFMLTKWGDASLLFGGETFWRLYRGAKNAKMERVENLGKTIL